jgi:alpha-mannosidase
VTIESVGGAQGGSAPAAANAPPPSRRIAVVPHTHWDREWYEPFQTFRFDLVRLVDDLLETM